MKGINIYPIRFLFLDERSGTWCCLLRLRDLLAMHSEMLFCSAVLYEGDMCVTVTFLSVSVNQCVIIKVFPPEELSLFFYHLFCTNCIHLCTRVAIKCINKVYMNAIWERLFSPSGISHHFLWLLRSKNADFTAFSKFEMELLCFSCGKLPQLLKLQAQDSSIKLLAVKTPM